MLPLLYQLPNPPSRPYLCCAAVFAALAAYASQTRLPLELLLSLTTWAALAGTFTLLALLHTEPSRRAAVRNLRVALLVHLWVCVVPPIAFARAPARPPAAVAPRTAPSPPNPVWPAGSPDRRRPLVFSGDPGHLRASC